MGLCVNGLHRIIIAVGSLSPTPKTLDGDHHRTSVLLFDTLPAEPALKFHARLLPILLDKGNDGFPPNADIRCRRAEQLLCAIFAYFLSPREAGEFRLLPQISAPRSEM